MAYRAFVDPSGGSSDSMTLAIAHKQGDIGVLDAVREVRPPFSPEAVVTEFAALLKAYRVPDVVGDRYAGEWPRERFRAAGIGYRSSRRAAYIGTPSVAEFRQGRAAGRPTPSQLCGLERRTTRGGRDSTDHAPIPGAHDDVANADVPSLEAILVDEHDPHVNALGIKGVGEIGITGTARTVANALWHATGVRVRQFPYYPRSFDRVRFGNATYLKQREGGWIVSVAVIAPSW